MIDFEALGRMTLDGDDDDDRDRLMTLHTHAAVLESGGADCGVALLGFLRHDGIVTQVGFMDLASVGEFVRTTKPQHLDIFVGSDENDREIEAAVRAAFRRQIH